MRRLNEAGETTVIGMAIVGAVALLMYWGWL